MKTWLIRCAVLLAIPTVLAVVHAQVNPASAPKQPNITAPAPPEPAPPSDPAGETAEPAPTPEVVETPAHAQPAPGDTDDTEWLLAHFDAGTAMFIDARPRYQYEEGHIPMAYSLPFEDFLSGRPDALDLLPTDMPLIIYCGGGDCDASHKVKTMLEKYGFSDLYVYTPGWPGWEETGRPSEQGPPPF